MIAAEISILGRRCCSRGGIRTMTPWIDSKLLGSRPECAYPVYPWPSSTRISGLGSFHNSLPSHKQSSMPLDLQCLAACPRHPSATTTADSFYSSSLCLHCQRTHKSRVILFFLDYRFLDPSNNPTNFDAIQRAIDTTRILCFGAFGSSSLNSNLREGLQTAVRH